MGCEGSSHKGCWGGGKGEGVRGRGRREGGGGLIVSTNTISTEYLRLSFIGDAVSTMGIVPYSTMKLVGSELTSASSTVHS